MLAIIHFLLLNVQALSGEEGDLVKRNHIRRRSTSTIRTPAEYEPVDAVILGWDDNIEDINTNIAKAAIAGKAKVFTTGGPATIKGIDPKMYKRFDLKVESAAIRRFGPHGIFKNGKVVLGNPEFLYTDIAPNADAFTARFAKLTSYKVHKIPFVLDHSELMFDSKGSLFTTEQIYEENSGKSKEEVNALVREHLGAKKIRVVPTDILFAKLLNDETVLISMADDVGPHKKQGQKTIEYFKSIKTPSGKKYTILTVKAFITGLCWQPYTHSLLVNNVAIVPSYKGHEEYEKSAVEKIYKEALPGVRVIFVPLNGRCEYIREQVQTIPSPTPKKK